MKIILAILGALTVGVAGTIYVTTLPAVAPLYSQAIYDCGIRISAHARGGKISGFEISGAKAAVCIESDNHSTVISDNIFN